METQRVCPCSLDWECEYIGNKMCQLALLENQKIYWEKILICLMENWLTSFTLDANIELPVLLMSCPSFPLLPVGHRQVGPPTSLFLLKVLSQYTGLLSLTWSIEASTKLAKQANSVVWTRLHAVTNTTVDRSRSKLLASLGNPHLSFIDWRLCYRVMSTRPEPLTGFYVQLEVTLVHSPTPHFNECIVKH